MQDSFARATHSAYGAAGQARRATIGYLVYNALFYIWVHKRMMINHSTLEYHVTNFNTLFRWLWWKNRMMINHSTLEYHVTKGPSTKDVRQMGRGGGFEISDIPGRGEGGGL